ncbi:MAG: ATP phosphoribosyltransferase regulatory subunit, partial [bacterium]|nr:ATP phosphoribosyltransferase regulatory subunit [bacterium]
TERISDSDRKLLSALTTFYGEEEILEIAASFKGADTEVFSYLTKIIDIISKKGYHEYVTIDLGEVRGFDYYTGVIIEGFASGVGKPILYGGRYDSLAEKYGSKAASMGFAFDIKRLLTAIDNI